MKVNSYTSYNLIPSNTKIMNKDSLVLTSKPDFFKDFTPETEDEINAKRAMSTPDIAPENKYAEIKVNGEVVANVWKSGLVSMPNKYGSSSLGNELANIIGPQQRVDFLEKYFGGKAEYYNQKAPSYSFSASLAQIISSNNK